MTKIGSAGKRPSALEFQDMMPKESRLVATGAELLSIRQCDEIGSTRHIGHATDRVDIDDGSPSQAYKPARV